MSHEIIKAIYRTEDGRILVEHAANNLLPHTFRCEEYESLTRVLRTEGLRRLDEEILRLYFRRCWQGAGRYARAVERAIAVEHLNIYDEWARCRDEEGYARSAMAHIARKYLEPLDL